MTKQLSTAPKTFCFALMPFDESFDDIYMLGIKESCSQVGAYCERVDEQIFTETILERIYNQIAKADLIIADMTGRNPNVFYEVGYAHALGKATILLTKNADDIPFDLKHYPHIVYSNKISKLKDELTPRIKWFMENPVDKNPQYKLDIDLYLLDKNLSNGNIVYESPINMAPHPKITVHNNSSQTYVPGALRIGILTSNNFNRCSAADREFKIISTVLPDSKIMHNLPELPTLFPQSYETLYFVLRGFADKLEEYSEDIIIRLFTVYGTRDYPLNIRRLKKMPTAG